VTIDRRFTCVEALRRLDDYLDHELIALDARRVEAHLRECEACAKEFGFERSVIDQLRGKLRDVKLPAALRHRIMATLDEIA
jgi:anti-sigma factor (TIGR02949 family)